MSRQKYNRRKQEEHLKVGFMVMRLHGHDPAGIMALPSVVGAKPHAILRCRHCGELYWWDSRPDMVSDCLMQRDLMRGER